MKANNKSKKKENTLYNGPQTRWNELFIQMIDMRMDRRPWTPSQEVTVMRSVSVLIGMVGEDVIRRLNKQRPIDEDIVQKIICDVAYNFERKKL